jgi:hypothetical protein
MRRITRVLAGSFLLTAFLATPVLAQTYPPGAPSVGVSDAIVTPGESITVSGAGWLPGSLVDLTFESAPIALGTARVRADGTFSTTVTIPIAASPGTHFIVASGTAADGTQATATTTITVLAAGGGAGAPGTGANLGAGILILAALLVVGVTALVGTRRRLVAQPQHAAETRSQ